MWEGVFVGVISSRESCGSVGEFMVSSVSACCDVSLSDKEITNAFNVSRFKYAPAKSPATSSGMRIRASNFLTLKVEASLRGPAE